jgi:nitroreductase
MKEHLRPAAYGQPQITDSSHLVVFAYKRAVTANDVARFIDLNAEVRGVGRETLTDFEGMLNASAKRSIDGGYNEVWNSRQAYIALGFLLQSAALLGIDATPMEGFEPAKFNEILGLEDYSAVALAAVGYRAADDSLATLPKVRGRREDLVVRI